MADDNHTQMLMQQQPQPPSQQSHMQSPQLQPSQAQQTQQLQQSQLQQSQLQQSQLQQSQLQQAQLQQSQLQQSQLQQSQLQQSQLQQSQLQQSQLQQSQLQQTQMQQPQLQQAQLQQTQLQQSQLQQQSQIQQQSNSMQQQSQQQGAMSMGSAVEQSNMNVTSSVPINVATINVSQSQQLQALQQNVNTSSGTPVQMAVSQLTAQAQTLPAGTMMSQSSGPHPTMMHPTMTMAQAPMQQVQVIQQPLSASYLQHLYTTPQQQMLFPGNLTLQHAGMTTPTLQSLGATQGLSLQLQAKATLDPKTSGGQNIQAVNSANKQAMAVNAGSMMTASGQIIGTSKGNFPQQMMTGPGKSTIIHSQSGYAPANANQTVVFGVVPNQQSIFSHKALTDSQKGKTYTFQNQQATLQPKSIYSSSLPVHSSAQVFNGSHLKQISSQPQIITTQAPGTMLSHSQLLGLQALSSLPPGLSWAAPGCLQSTALQLGQNPIIIRSQQSDMFIQQTQPQTAMHLPVAAAAQPVPPTSFATTSIAPQKQKQVKVRPGTQTVAVATQTNVSSAATINSNSAPVRTQIKPKVRTSAGPHPGASPSPSTPQMATTQTQTNQSPPQPPPQPVVQQKSDAGNQTYSNQMKMVHAETKSTGMQSKSVSVEAKHVSPQKSQAMVAPSAKIPQASVTPTIDVSVSSAPSTLTTVSSTTSILTTSSVQVNTNVSTVDTVSSTVPSIPTVPPVPNVVNKTVPEPISKKLSSEAQNECIVSSQQTNTTETVVVTEHLKPQQPIQKPQLGPVKDKQPQKAIVKPQVLTHVIEGLVIQEGSEPFPVSRSALLDSPCRILPSEKPDSHLKRRDSPTVASPEKKMKVHRPRGGPGRKKKMYRGRKGLRKQALIEDEEINSTPIEESISAPDDESTVSNKTEEENSEPPSDSPHQIPMEVDKPEVEAVKTESDVTQKLPTKWTVQDVFEFIQNLPGCSDYADTFKSQEIDGQALLLLKEDHLMTAMCMKLGPALKLISQIRSMKEELGQ